MIKLRAFIASDTDLLVSYLNSSEVTRYITSAIAQPYTERDAQWWVEEGSGIAHAKAIEFNGTLVGCISAKVGEFEYNRSAELGYWVARGYWNKGIASEAVKLFTGSIFSSTDITRLFVSVVAENRATLRVLEKNAYTSEGTHRQASFKNGRYFDEHCLVKLRS